MALATCSSPSDCFPLSVWGSWHVNTSLPWLGESRAVQAMKPTNMLTVIWWERVRKGPGSGKGLKRQSGNGKACGLPLQGPPGCCDSVILQQRWQAHHGWRSSRPQCPFIASSVSKMNGRLKPIPPSPCQNPSQLIKVMGPLARCWETRLLPPSLALPSCHFGDSYKVCRNPDSTFTPLSKERQGQRSSCSRARKVELARSQWELQHLSRAAGNQWPTKVPSHANATWPATRI